MEDVAECVSWVVLATAHVNIDEVVVRPLAQATATVMHRAVTAKNDGGPLDA